MNHKIQLSVALLSAFVIALWVFSDNQSHSPNQNSSTSELPVLEVKDSPTTVKNENYSTTVKAYLDSLGVSQEEMESKKLQETVATYTNDEGHQVEIIVRSGKIEKDISQAM